MKRNTKYSNMAIGLSAVSGLLIGAIYWLGQKHASTVIRAYCEELEMINNIRQ